jgi:hypothetical protein
MRELTVGQQLVLVRAGVRLPHFKLSEEGDSGMQVRAFPAQRSHNFHSVSLVATVPFPQDRRTISLHSLGLLQVRPCLITKNVTEEMRHGLEGEGRAVRVASYLLLARVEGHPLRLRSGWISHSRSRPATSNSRAARS